MSIDQIIKTALGEVIFQNCVLQEQLQQANTKINELKDKKDKKNG